MDALEAECISGKALRAYASGLRMRRRLALDGAWSRGETEALLTLGAVLGAAQARVATVRVEMLWERRVGFLLDKHVVRGMGNNGKHQDKK